MSFGHIVFETRSCQGFVEGLDEPISLARGASGTALQEWVELRNWPKKEE